MKTKEASNPISTIHVVLKNSKVYVKDNMMANTWYSINFQWIPIVKQNMKIS